VNKLYNTLSYGAIFNFSGEPDRPLNLSPPKPFLTRLEVIENGCSRLPKQFDNFQKLRSTHAYGSKITTQLVEFKV